MIIRNFAKIIFLLILLVVPFSASALININTAGLEELDEIPEVGLVIAGRIIDYRNTNGPFETIEEIKNVSGIGDVTFLKMKDYITVGSGGGSSGADDEDEAEADEADSDSVHSGDASLSDYEAEETFKISAGRERLATVRTPITFLASSNKKNREAKFVWSFGDGTKAIGTEVRHAYQFSGNYQVVLNGYLGKEDKAVARTTVLVAESSIDITDINLGSGYIELTNAGNKEQNLSGWSLMAGEKKYIFPLDTIIGSRQAIKMSLEALGLAGTKIDKIDLVYPDGNEASSFGAIKSDLKKIAVLEEKLQDLKRQLATLKPDAKIASIDAASNDGKLSENKKVVVLNKEPSLIEKIKNALFKR